MERYVMSLVQEKYKVTCLIFNKLGHKVCKCEHNLKMIELVNGWKEYDPVSLYLSIVKVGNDALRDSNLSAADIATIGISSTRGGVIVWDSETGKPIYNAIASDCPRTEYVCRNMKSDGLECLVRNTCGIKIDSTYSATKIKWIFDNIEGARDKASKGKICAGTIDTWILWNLTAGKSFATDCTNAAFTMLYNMFEGKCWETKLLEYLDIPEVCLPKVELSSCFYGHTDESVFGGPIMVGCLAEDQHSRLFGQLTYDLGTCRAYYEGGSKIIYHTGLNSFLTETELITTFAYGIAGKYKYSLESKTFQYDKINYSEINSEEFLVYHVYRSIKIAEEETNSTLEELKVDGIDSKNDNLMQLQADMLQIPVIRPSIDETSALGVAYIAGVATGYWPNGRKDIVPFWKVDRRFEPRISKKERDEMISRYERAINHIVS